MSRFLEHDVKMKPQASSYLEPPWRGARTEAAARSEALLLLRTPAYQLLQC